MRVKAIDLWDEARGTVSDKFKGYRYIANGVGNDYPSLIELLVGASPTAKACAGVIADFIYGRGFALERDRREAAKAGGVRFRKDDLYVNEMRETPNDLLKKVARSVALHKGAFLHVNYNAAGEKVSVRVLPYRNCRLGERDSNGYVSKVLVYNDWDERLDKRQRDDAVRVLDRYDPRAEVIGAQVERAGGWDRYGGQVFFLNLDRNDSYPLAWADVVMQECESERLSAKYTKNGFKKGFFGTYAFVTPMMEDEKLRSEFREELRKSIGVEAEQSVFHFEAELQGDKLEEQVLIEPIESNVKADLFEYADKKTANNIRKAYGNVPLVLIDYVEGKLGNTSGEALAEARAFMKEQMQEERQDVQEMFEELFDNFHRRLSENGVFEILI